MNQLELLRFNVLRNALYHGARRKTLERRSRWATLVVILLGAAAIGDFLLDLGIKKDWIGALVALVGALQLVIDWSGRATTHTALQRSYYHLLADIDEVTEPSAINLAKWQSTMTRITADEPPTLRVVDAKAYNDALDATEGSPEQRLRIGAIQSLFGGIFTFDGTRFRKLDEIAKK